MKRKKWLSGSDLEVKIRVTDSFGNAAPPSNQHDFSPPKSDVIHFCSEAIAIKEHITTCRDQVQVMVMSNENIGRYVANGRKSVDKEKNLPTATPPFSAIQVHHGLSHMPARVSGKGDHCHTTFS